PTVDVLVVAADVVVVLVVAVGRVVDEQVWPVVTVLLVRHLPAGLEGLKLRQVVVLNPELADRMVVVVLKARVPDVQDRLGAEVVDALAARGVEVTERIWIRFRRRSLLLGSRSLCPLALLGQVLSQGRSRAHSRKILPNDRHGSARADRKSVVEGKGAEGG